MSGEPTERDVEALIEASSLGTPEAKAARESVPVEVGQAITLVAAHHERFDFRGDSLGCSCGHHWLYKGHLARIIAERIAQARHEGLGEAAAAIGSLIKGHRHDSSEPCDLAPALAAVAALRGDA